MAKHDRTQLLHFCGWVGLGIWGWVGVGAAVAQVVPDDTLGAERSQVSSGITVRGLLAELVTGGAARRSALFHSFSTFNVGEGQRVYFANPVGIETILTRVTGENPSNILGTLGVNGGASLFLLNPQGILFGPNARLDVAGSFVASTAERFAFADGSEFSAVNPQAAPLLTVNLRPGLQYGANTTGRITNLGNLTTGQDLILSAGTVDTQGQLRAGGDLTVRALDTVRVRDTGDRPFVAAAGGQLLVQGDRAIDIFALNHPDSGLFSGGDMVLRSADQIIGDAHYYSTGNFRIEKLDHTPGNLLSPADPIILAIGDVVLGDYIGESLHILAGGSVTMGNVTITGPGDVFTTINPNNPNPLFAALAYTPYGVIDGSTGSTLDVRAGIDWAALGLSGNIFIPSAGGVFNPNPALISAPPSLSDSRIRITSINNGSLAGPNGPTFLTNNYLPNLRLPIGSIEISNSIGAFSNVVVESRGNIRTGSPSALGLGSIDTSVPALASGVNGLRGFAGSIVLLANGSIDTTRGKLNSIVGTIDQTTGAITLEDGTAGDIFLFSQNGRIDTAEITSSVRGGQSGNIFLEAGGDIKTFGRITSFAQATSAQGVAGNGGNINLLSRGGSIDTRGGDVNSTTGFGFSGNITLEAFGNIVTGSDSTNGPAVGSYVGANGNGVAGKITLTSTTGTIDTRAGTLNSATDSGNGGDITLKTTAGDIFTANINSFTNGAGNAGAVFIESSGRFSLANSKILSRTSGTGRGGDITIKAESVSLTNLAFLQSTTEAPGTGNSGNVQITANSLFMDGGSEVLVLTQGAGNAGAITVNVAGTMTLSGVAPSPRLPDGRLGGFSTGLFASTEQGATGQAGVINITSGSLRIEKGAAISARSKGAGNVVDPPNSAAISVITNTLDIESGGQILTTAFDSGRAGSIAVTATGNINISGSDLSFNARLADLVEDLCPSSTCSISDRNAAEERAQSILDPTGPRSGLQAQSVSPNGTGSGNIIINSTNGSINISDNAEIDSSLAGTNSQAGTIGLFANSGQVKLDNARVFSTLEPGAVNSAAGGIFILADTIALSNNAQLQTLIRGGADGRAGTILVLANKTIDSSASGIFSIIDKNATGSIDINSPFSNADIFGVGKGAIAIGAGGQISFTNGAKVDVSTAGQGDAGRVAILSNGGSISFSGDGSGVFSTVGIDGRGNADGIAIQGKSLTLGDGAELQVLTRGQGNAGIISVVTTDSVNLSGVSPQGFSTGLFSSTESTANGNGGIIFVKTNAFKIADGAVLSARTRNDNFGGAILVDANTVEAEGGGQILTTAFGRGQAGNIFIGKDITVDIPNNTATINTPSQTISLSGREEDFFARQANAFVIESNLGLQQGDIFDNIAPGASGIFANTERTSTAQGGNILIATDRLSISNGAKLSVSTLGGGNAGDIVVDGAQVIRLDKRSEISATTASGDGGNITLKASKALILGRSSNIRTDGGQNPDIGNGGNITISTPFILAIPTKDSNITSQTFIGIGGKIDVSSVQRFFDIDKRDQDFTTSNDITAAAQNKVLGLDGIVILNVPNNFDPSRSLVPLPLNLVDRTQQLDRSCRPGSTQSAGSFTSTGRGGLPPSPTDPLPSPPFLAPWVSLDPDTPTTFITPTPTPRSSVAPDEIIEAQGYTIAPNGDITLVAQASTLTPHLPWSPTANCHALQTPAQSAP